MLIYTAAFTHTASPYIEMQHAAQIDLAACCVALPIDNNGK